MPFLAPLWLFFSPVLEFWNKLPNSIKVLIIILLAAFSGFVYGGRVERNKCEARAQASIVEARRIDTEANATAFKKMEDDKEKYRIEALNNENKLTEAATAFNTLKEECSANEDFVQRNNDIGSELSTKRLPKQIPSSKPRPTPNR